VVTAPELLERELEKRVLTLWSGVLGVETGSLDRDGPVMVVDPAGLCGAAPRNDSDCSRHADHSESPSSAKSPGGQYVLTGSSNTGATKRTKRLRDSRAHADSSCGVCSGSPRSRGSAAAVGNVEL
jgi:hypothetical protein